MATTPSKRGKNTAFSEMRKKPPPFFVERRKKIKDKNG
jgi:hypothetical protein